MLKAVFIPDNIKVDVNVVKHCNLVSNLVTLFQTLQAFCSNYYSVRQIINKIRANVRYVTTTNRVHLFNLCMNTMTRYIASPHWKTFILTYFSIGENTELLYLPQ